MSSVLLVLYLVAVASLALSPPNCNYVVDTTWQQVRPPSKSPTPEPTPDPTPAPIGQATFATTNYDDEFTINSDSVSISVFASPAFLNPYIMNHCYSYQWEEAHFSIKYSCKPGENTLIRNIYWDSLNCDGDNSDTTSLDEQSEGTVFVCDQTENCDAASVTVQDALTPNPTEYPTPGPVIGTPQTTQYQMDNDINPFECANTLGPNKNPTIQWIGAYAYDICVSLDSLKLKVSNGTEDPFGSLSWKCDKDTNTFSLSLYEDEKCNGQVQNPTIEYMDDKCFGNFAWTFVDCGMVPETTNTISDPTSTAVTNPVQIMLITLPIIIFAIMH